MRQANLTRFRDPSAPNQPCRRDRMMRRPERAAAHESAAGILQLAGGAEYFGHLQRLPVAKFRKDAWQAFDQHCFACSGRTDQDNIMHSGSRNHQCPLHMILSKHITVVFLH
ncbi:hypothetical protein D3C73_861320 [compost metagenome]